MKFFSIFFALIAAFSLGLVFYYILNRNKSSNSNKKNYTIIVSIFLICFSAYILAISLDLTNDFIIHANQEQTDYGKVGAFGDLVGGIMNPVVAFIGIIAASLAFYAQYKANEQVHDQFKIQQFESQFYEMLRLHKENINEMRITGYEPSIETSIHKDNEDKIVSKTETITTVTRVTEGRKVFVTMITELIACYEILEYYDNLWQTNIDRQNLLELAYRFFFFGSKSEIVSSNHISNVIINNFRIEINRIRDLHKNSSGVKNRISGVGGKEIKLYVKYLPFSGHENRLGHYYRHLYSTVKYIVTKEKEGLIDYKEAREYLKILRSQMSNDEQLMLYYNYIIGFGRDWENEGYLTKYRMLHNLPINKVKHAELPRKHFQDFIKSIKPGESSLFEWGDVEI